MKLFISFLLLLPILPAAQTQKPPNVILIFMDDMGYGDMGAYGALQFQTPNLDRLAAEGVRFTNFVTAQPVCSASRAALLTGCYPNRIGISGALFPDSKVGINPKETLLPEMLKGAGYITSMIGKWHLGIQKEFLPLQHGFDSYFGLPYSNDMWPVGYDGKPARKDQSQYRFPPLPLMRGDQPAEIINTMEKQSNLTARYTQEAVSFIKKNQFNTFFLYLAHSMPHVPIAASSKFKGRSRQGTYGDVMMEIDWSVGEILKTLKELWLEKNTIVIFTSDNGPWLKFGNHAGSSGGFREGKGTNFEGGHRVPCIVRWTDRFPAGVVTNKLSSTIDILPTLAAVCKLKLPENKNRWCEYPAFDGR
jgi:arylsulfatase